MLGTSKNGFTLIEILIAIVIVGIIMAIAVPNLRRLTPSRPRKEFIGNLNAVNQFALNNALVTRKVHQVHFDFGKKKVTVKAATGALKENEAEFVPIKGTHLNSNVTIPKTITFQNFIIEGSDQLAISSSRSEAWYFIVPDGMAQAVTINFTDSKDTLPSGKPRPVGLVLNPFSARYKVYDSFQK
jgi:prepilin-type N-terminal cleavage/methylation domain-containing protein